ncbi:MAG: NAD(P)H-binding protein [Rhodospirillaceae bacterium]
MTKPILVLGGNGTVGNPLVQALLAKGAAVRVGSRSANAPEGTSGVAFDYAKPETFDPAFAGVQAAYVLMPAGHTDVFTLLKPVIETAAAKGVKVVLQTAIGVNASDEIPYRQAELLLEKAGIPYVILRPNWFADNFRTFWLPGVQGGTIALPAGTGKTSFIDARDIAAAAAEALTSSAHDGNAFDLTGPEALDHDAVAALIAALRGKPVSYQAIEDEAFINTLTSVGVSQDYAAFLALIYGPVRDGHTAAVTDAVERLTGAKPRSFQQHLTDYAAAYRS